MILIQEMTTGSYFFYNIKRQGIRIDFITPFNPFNHPAHFIIDDKFFIAHAIKRLQNPGAVQNKIDAAKPGH